ncbi:MAG: PIN domain-containing protein, partial [Thermocrispum sp.]
MIVVADTSGLIAAVDAHHDLHEQCRRAISAAHLLVISPLVLAELDYLLATRESEAEAIVVSADIAREAAEGRYDIPAVTSETVVGAARLRLKYRALELAMTDAVNVVLAGRYATDAVLT